MMDKLGYSRSRQQLRVQIFGRGRSQDDRQTRYDIVQRRSEFQGRTARHVAHQYRIEARWRGPAGCRGFNQLCEADRFIPQRRIKAVWPAPLRAFTSQPKASCMTPTCPANFVRRHGHHMLRWRLVTTPVAQKAI
jgi:hypothetical protein